MTANSTPGGLLIRALAYQDQVRVLACISTGVVEEGRQRQGTLPTATAAFGRLLTAGLLLGTTLKDREQVMLQVIGDGPLRYMVTVADARGNVRGYVGQPLVHLPANGEGKLDVARAVGQGQLHVVRDSGLREPYRSSVPLVNGEIATDLAYYLARSEQTPSAVALGVLVNPDGSVGAAGGWLVQPLPGFDPAVVAELETKARAQVPPPTEVLRAMARPDDPTQLVRPLLGREAALRVVDRREVRFRCECSRARFEAGLLALGAAELEHMAADAGPDGIELTCRFCGRRYRVPAARLFRLAQKAAAARKPAPAVTSPTTAAAVPPTDTTEKEPDAR